jgi:hypothetical protein
MLDTGRPLTPHRDDAHIREEHLKSYRCAVVQSSTQVKDKTACNREHPLGDTSHHRQCFVLSVECITTYLGDRDLLAQWRSATLFDHTDFTSSYYYWSLLIDIVDTQPLYSGISDLRVSESSPYQ